MRKNLWCFEDNRIAVRFQYESHDREGQWWRSYRNELWDFDENGLMRRREASINDLQIDERERRIFGPRPKAEHGQEFPLREPAEGCRRITSHSCSAMRTYIVDAPEKRSMLAAP